MVSLIRSNPLRVATMTALVAGTLAVSPIAASAETASIEMATRAAIEGQIAAFKARDDERAFSYAAPGVRRMFGSSNNFIAMVKRGYKPVYSPKSFTFGRSNERNGVIYQEVMVTGPAGKEWIALYTLQRQDDGTMLITGCRLAEDDSFAI